MIAKGLKEPKDKIDLLRVLDMGKVLGALEERTRETRKGRPEDDDQEEQFRESLGKLLSTLGPELLDLTKEDLPEEIRTHANQMLEELYPVTIQLVADEYDDTSSTAFPFVHALLLAVSDMLVLIIRNRSDADGAGPKIEKGRHWSAARQPSTRLLAATIPDTNRKIKMG
jgi:hypothetical protein